MMRDDASCLYYPFIASLVSREFNAISHNAIRYVMYVNDALISHHSFYVHRMAKEDTLQICIFLENNCISRIICAYYRFACQSQNTVSQLHSLFASKKFFSLSHTQSHRRTKMTWTELISVRQEIETLILWSAFCYTAGSNNLGRNTLYQGRPTDC